MTGRPGGTPDRPALFFANADEERTGTYAFEATSHAFTPERRASQA